LTLVSLDRLDDVELDGYGSGPWHNIGPLRWIAASSSSWSALGSGKPDHISFESMKQ